MSNEPTTTINNTPKDDLHKIMVEMFMMIEEMDIQEGKYLEFAEMFKSMNISIDRLSAMRNQIIINTYYQRHVRPQRASSNPRLTEAQKENSSHYSLCNCGRYVSNVTPKFALKHLNTAVHYQGVRNRKYAHTTFNNEEINDKIKTEVVIQCFIIKHLIEVRKRIAETAEEELSVAEEIITCENCFLIECCCEADRLQVIQDDENARANGYVEVDGRWVNKYHTSYNLKEEKEKTDIVKICVRCKYLEPHAPFGDADGTFGDCGHEYMSGLRLCRSCVECNRVQRGLDEEYGGNCRCSYCGSTTHNGNLISPPNDRWYCNDCGLVEYEAEQKREKRRIYQKKWRAQKKEMKETGEIYIGMPRK